MTLLVIAPEYASHALPLMTIAGAWQRRGQRVVVATGPSLDPTAKLTSSAVRQLMRRSLKERKRMVLTMKKESASTTAVIM